ncbi:MAG: molecular chaperone HtpG [Chloroflexi bacterium]|nr:MAG: molecular chaperone HtpG [Chloroflexota bacterium]PIE81056.1 MAG: molecular chaperone HtpG [Chloroflexota bacterium]
MSTQEKQATYNFKTEVKQVLQILVHSLYKDRDIFVRELISNASDALTRFHFESLTNREVLDPDAELAIHIDVVETEEDELKKIIIKDSGIGMTEEELIRNLGTIAQSGAREFLAKMSEGGLDPGDVIGQFGVGFYSVFMVSDNVRVVSRSYQPDAKAAAWVSDGSESFSIEPAEKEDRGTEIHITLKKEADEFANDWKLKQIVKKHSDFVRYPVYVGEDQANQQESLWRKSSSDVAVEEYKSFYQQMTMDFEEPLASIHFSTDAPVHLRALLFIPAKREPSILALRKEPGVMLYSHNVLIQEYCTDLLPDWLGFVDGVVDSEDLPLNVSRETVQNNRLMMQLGKVIRKRVLRELRKMAEKEPEKYKQFWEENGRSLKEALATDPMARDDVQPFFRYYSSKSDDTLTSLDDYIERMPETQDEIYYVLGDSKTTVAHSPHLDPFKSRDLEVLYWVDPLDVLIAPGMLDYKDKKFRNIDDAGLELPEMADEETAKDTEPAIEEADFNRLIGQIVKTLGDKVVEVRESKVLKNSPVRLVYPEDAQNREMQRLYRMMDQDYEVPKLIFEVNRSHPLLVNLAELVTEKADSELVTLSIEQLYDSALVQEGLHPNPTAMLPRIEQLLLLVAKADVNQDS